MINENYQFILEQIRKIRPQNTPKLIAVSKKQPLSKINEALNSGLRIFGENQIKEGIEKFSDLQTKFPDLELHHIGPVQSGNLRKLFGLFTYTHGVGSLSSLEELIKQAPTR